MNPTVTGQHGGHPGHPVRLEWSPSANSLGQIGDDDDELMLNVLRCHLTY